MMGRRHKLPNYPHCKLSQNLTPIFAREEMEQKPPKKAATVLTTTMAKRKARRKIEFNVTPDRMDDSRYNGDEATPEFEGSLDRADTAIFDVGVTVEGTGNSKVAHSMRAIVTPADRRIMSDHSHFMLEQLHLCQDNGTDNDNRKNRRVLKKNLNSNATAAAAAVTSAAKYHGFECIHCQGKGFRCFPATVNDVLQEYVNFRRHLETNCKGCPINLREVLLNWKYAPNRFAMQSLSKWILKRLCYEDRGDDEVRDEEEEAVVAMESLKTKCLLAKKKKRKMAHGQSVLERV